MTNPIDNPKKPVSGVTLSLLLVAAVGAIAYFQVSSLDKTIKTKEAQVEALKTNELALSKSAQEAQDEAKRLADENAAMKKNLKDFESEKSAIINQVKSSVATFESFRNQASGEIESLKAGVAKLQVEKEEATKKLDEIKALSDSEKEKLTSDIKSLNDKIGEFKSMEKKLTSTIKGQPKNIAASETGKLHYNLGNFYFRAGDYKAAVREYVKALSHNGEDADTHWNLAVVCDQKLDDRTTAAAHYRKYLSLRPMTPDAKRIQQRIYDLEASSRVMTDDYSASPGRDMRSDGLIGGTPEKFNSMRLMKDK